MEKKECEPRSDWKAIVEQQGMYYHTTEVTTTYWDESTYYEFSEDEIDLLETATHTCHKMCMEAVDYVIDEELWDLFMIPEPFRHWITRSWDSTRSWPSSDRTIYGRFDFSYRPGEQPMLLEYNADTPTALLEQAVIQWFWLRDKFPDRNQFNSTHERLIEVFKEILEQVGDERFYFAAQGGVLEDYMTVQYLRDVAVQAGFGPVAQTTYIDMERIGWNGNYFTDENERRINHIFKLYPWEWLVREEFGRHMITANTQWYEPPWKAILSNKAILPILWKLNDGHPNLLASYFDPADLNKMGLSSFVRKPLYSREGANVTVVSCGEEVMKTDGPYDNQTTIYQELWELPQFANRYPVIGSWVINGWPTGIGIREDSGPITRNTSRFVPHLFGKRRHYGS